MLIINDSHNNPAFKRALSKARETEPEVTEIVTDWLYTVAGSKGDSYKVEFTLLNGKLAATCNCPAHTGIDPNGNRPVPPDYIPRDCYHIARAYDYRRDQVAAEAEARAKANNGFATIDRVCLWCKSDKANANGPLVIAKGFYEHPLCSPDRDSYHVINEPAHVPLKEKDAICGECKDAIAEIDGLCGSCYDLMRYSDYAGASRFQPQSLRAARCGNDNFRTQGWVKFPSHYRKVITTNASAKNYL